MSLLSVQYKDHKLPDICLFKIVIHGQMRRTTESFDNLQGGLWLRFR